MNRPSMHTFLYTSVVVATLGLTSCIATQITATEKDPAYNPQAMKRVLVIAVVRKPKTRQWLEEAFVKELNKRKSEATASYTMVREDEKLDETAWKKLVNDNHFDSVVISRLMDLEVIEKDVDAKVLNGPGTSAGAYGYYSYSYASMYQPGFTLRKETAAVQTRVYDSAQDKMVWSAHSRTDIEQGRDPEAQIRDFVRLMIGKIYK